MCFDSSHSFLLKNQKEFLLQNSSVPLQRTTVFTDTPLKQFYESSNKMRCGCARESFYLSFQNILIILTQTFQVPPAVADNMTNNRTALGKERTALSTAEVLISVLLYQAHHMHLTKLRKCFGKCFPCFLDA